MRSGRARLVVPGHTYKHIGKADGCGDLCACGCGQTTGTFASSGRARLVVPGHTYQTNKRPPSQRPSITCSCGCGETVTQPRAGRLRRRIAGHACQHHDPRTCSCRSKPVFYGPRLVAREQQRIVAARDRALRTARTMILRALNERLAHVYTASLDAEWPLSNLVGTLAAYLKKWMKVRFWLLPKPVVLGQEPHASNIIYGLVEPATLMVRYVGQSAKGVSRPMQHVNTRERSYKANWVAGLHARGQQFGIVVLEEVADADDLALAEMWWIAYGRACGWQLTNVTAGGEGTRGYRKSPEAIVQMQETAKALWLRPDYREAQKRTWTPARRKLMSDAQANVAWSDARRRANGERVRARNLGRKVSEETRQRLSKAARSSSKVAAARAKRFGK